MSGTTVEELRQQLAAAQTEVDRLREALEKAEWLRAYDGVPEAA
ncbi:hypothetical protein [Ottowia thiooxydans]|nr:hypothetical protein [Ottowia thiooxydans]